MSPKWSLPKTDSWSTPFAQALLHHLKLFPGATVLDIASGGGIPVFHIAEQVGLTGRVLGVDINPNQVLRARAIKGSHLPWLTFEVADMRNLHTSLPRFDRITGNLSLMFLRPNRFNALQNLVSLLKPGGQIVLTFPSLGTFDSLFQVVTREMKRRNFEREVKVLNEYIHERPSAEQARIWMKSLNMEKIQITEWPLEVKSGPGREFLDHPLLRRGFLDDIYECFENQTIAEEFMIIISKNLSEFQPLLAQRCAISSWAKEEK